MVTVRPGLSVAQIQQLPAVIDVVTAGRALGLGRTTSYQLARSGEFPCRIMRVGRKYLVPTADLLTLLGLHPSGRPDDSSRQGRGRDV
jgi:hypothetical protein